MIEISIQTFKITSYVAGFSQLSFPTITQLLYKATAFNPRSLNYSQSLGVFHSSTPELVLFDWYVTMQAFPLASCFFSASLPFSVSNSYFRFEGWALLDDYRRPTPSYRATTRLQRKDEIRYFDELLLESTDWLTNICEELLDLIWAKIQRCLGWTVQKTASDRKYPSCSCIPTDSPLRCRWWTRECTKLTHLCEQSTISVFYRALFYWTPADHFCGSGVK